MSRPTSSPRTEKQKRIQRSLRSAAKAYRTMGMNEREVRYALRGLRYVLTSVIGPGFIPEFKISPKLGLSSRQVRAVTVLHYAYEGELLARYYRTLSEALNNATIWVGRAYLARSTIANPKSLRRAEAIRRMKKRR